MKIGLLVFALVFASVQASAQHDSLVLNNGNTVVGEIKSMENNVLVIETDYSDSDFKIEWDKVREFYSGRVFILSDSEADRLIGTMNTDSTDKSNVLLVSDYRTMTARLIEVVSINPLEKDFLGRLKVSLGLGFNMTKANNLRQVNVRSNASYLTDDWGADASFDAVRSAQDSIAETKRTEASVGFRYLLPHDWYVLLYSSFLQNDEQKLKLRANPIAGLGLYVARTNELYVSVAAGGSWNIESYTGGEGKDRSSVEGFAGAELNIFNMGDLSLLTGVTVYPGISEKGRVRSDFKFDIKYDLPLDFYIKLGYTLNYDNRPVEGASESDYVLQITFGWDWN